MFGVGKGAVVRENNQCTDSRFQIPIFDHKRVDDEYLEYERSESVASAGIQDDKGRPTANPTSS